MKVKDLIQELERMDPEAEVIVTSSNFEHNGAMVPVSWAQQHNEGSSRVQTFRDAFDGDTYEKTTFSIIGGDTKVVTLT